jgi:hypothetical protein
MCGALIDVRFCWSCVIGVAGHPAEGAVNDPSVCDCKLTATGGWYLVSIVLLITVTSLESTGRLEYRSRPPSVRR